MSEVCQKLSVQDSILLMASCHNLPKTMRAVIEEGANLNVRRYDGYSPLLLASWYGVSGNVKILVEAGANINLTTSQDNSVSALLLAAQRGHKGVVKYLLEHGADKTLVDAGGDSALTVAQKMGHTEIAQLLSR